MSWLQKILGSDGTTQLAVEAYRKSARVSIVKRGHGFSIEALTGTIAAASNGTVFAIRNDPSSPYDVYIAQLWLDYCTIVAFTTPVTQRRLIIKRGAGAAPTGGTQIVSPIAQHDSADPASELGPTQGGEVRVSTTAVLGVAGITFETNAFGNLVLTQFGAANARRDQLFDYGATDKGAIVLQPGEVFAVMTSAAFDAAGTWQLGVNVSGFQVAPQAGE